MLAPLALLLVAPGPFEAAFTPAERTILAAPDRVVLLETPSAGRSRTRTLVGPKALAAVAALKSGLTLPADPKKCFNPRLRMTAYRGKAEVSMQICFECEQIRVDHKRPPYRNLPFSPKAAPTFARL